MDTIDFLYLSIVTQRLPVQCGGWTKDAIRQRGIALAVTWCAVYGGHRTYRTEDIPRLLTVMQDFTVVGYQVRTVDFEVLAGHMAFEFPAILDLAEVVERACGFKLSFDAVTRGTCMPKGRPDKPLPGATEITALRRTGDYDAVKRVCRINVNMIHFLHWRIMTHGQFAYVDGEEERHVVEVPKDMLSNCIH